MYVDRIANHTSALKASKALTPLPHFVGASTTPSEQVTVLVTTITVAGTLGINSAVDNELVTGAERCGTLTLRGL